MTSLKAIVSYFVGLLRATQKQVGRRNVLYILIDSVIFILISGPQSRQVKNWLNYKLQINFWYMYQHL